MPQESKIAYAVEAYPDIIEEMKVLFDAHWEEIDGDKDAIKLDPKYESYERMHKSGMLHMVTAREGSKMIGYLVSFVATHLHYAARLTAHWDIYYIAPEYRHGRVGIQLFKFSEAALKAIGVQKIYAHTSLKNDIGPILERLGYLPTERVYTKLVG